MVSSRIFLEPWWDARQSAGVEVLGNLCAVLDYLGSAAAPCILAIPHCDRMARAV